MHQPKKSTKTLEKLRRSSDWRWRDPVAMRGSTVLGRGAETRWIQKPGSRKGSSRIHRIFGRRTSPGGWLFLLTFKCMPRKVRTLPTPPAAHLRPEGLTFLRNLARHNDREWFTPRKAIFEAELKEPMLAIVRKVTDAMMDFAPAFVRPRRNASSASIATRDSAPTSCPTKLTSPRGGRTRDLKRLRAPATTST